MVRGMVRQESWINEVLRINSCIRGITEVKFGYSQLYDIWRRDIIKETINKYRNLTCLWR